MTLEHLAIFWLAVICTVLGVKNQWLRFQVKVLRDHQTRLLTRIVTMYSGVPQVEEADDVLDSDVIQ